MKGFIYKVTNKVNNKSYIGQTRYTVEFRWKQHQHDKDRGYFHNAIRKYGADNFTVEVLEECEAKDLDSREIFYIAKYNTINEGYNVTIGGGGKRTIVSDNQYEEIRGLYLSGFSAYKIASLFQVDKATILKILDILGVKKRNNNLNINYQELKELVKDYESGYSLRVLAKRYNCSPSGLGEFLSKKGVNLRVKYSLLNDGEAQINMIKEYEEGNMELRDIMEKYHCSYAIFTRILSKHGVKRRGKGGKSKLSDKDKEDIISSFKQGKSVKELAGLYSVDRGTIYNLFKKYHVDYLTI